MIDSVDADSLAIATTLVWTRAAKLAVQLGWSLRLLDDRADRRNPHLFALRASAARDMSVGVVFSTCASLARRRRSRSHRIDGKAGVQTLQPLLRLCMSTQTARLRLTPTPLRGL